MPLYRWFSKIVWFAEAQNRQLPSVYTVEMAQQTSRKEQVLAMLAAAHLGVVDISTKRPEQARLNQFSKAIRVLADDPRLEFDNDHVAPFFIKLQLSHRGQSGPILFDVEDESLGTQVWVSLIGPVVDALTEGSILLADELDASLHPFLAEHLVNLFQDPESNPLNAQLVFNSFDAAMLGDSVGERVLGRDQIWFTNKRHDGCTRLYPLSDFGPRRKRALPNAIATVDMARSQLCHVRGLVPLLRL